MGQLQVHIPEGEIESFCQRNHIRKLALFGSVLRDDFSADSDVDVLVEFEPGHVPGLIRLGGMAEEFSGVVGGRRVDLLTSEDLSAYFREDVLKAAEVLYG
ncbi:MAG TPA: nucleotidyltransferase domain-containing protein [Phycisphaerae bacterium]|nr:nucleotidyltransferase domain-containing protein [Phycisphaerae bacterium]